MSHIKELPWSLWVKLAEAHEWIGVCMFGLGSVTLCDRSSPNVSMPKRPNTCGSDRKQVQ